MKFKIITILMVLILLGSVATAVAQYGPDGLPDDVPKRIDKDGNVIESAEDDNEKEFLPSLFSDDDDEDKEEIRERAKNKTFAELTLRERNAWKDLSDEADDAINKARLQEKVRVNVTGIEQALLHVENERAREALELNLQRWQERNQLRYEEVDVVELSNNKTFIRGRREVRILNIIPIELVDEYEVNNLGEIVSENKGFLSRIFPPKRVEE